jgi:hypothetical protein
MQCGVVGGSGAAPARAAPEQEVPRSVAYRRCGLHVCYPGVSPFSPSSAHDKTGTWPPQPSRRGPVSHLDWTSDLIRGRPDRVASRRHWLPRRELRTLGGNGQLRSEVAHTKRGRGIGDRRGVEPLIAFPMWHCWGYRGYSWNGDRRRNVRRGKLQSHLMSRGIYDQVSPSFSGITHQGHALIDPRVSWRAAVIKMKAFIVGSLLAAAVSAIPMPEPTPVSYSRPSMPGRSNLTQAPTARHPLGLDCTEPAGRPHGQGCG